MNATTADDDFADRPWMEGADAPEQESGPAPIARPRNRGWAALAHGSALLAWLFAGVSPLVLVPLLIWQVVARKEQDEELAQASVEALNFQVNLALLVLGLSIVVVGLPLVPLALLVGLVLSLVATVQAAQGRPFRYPLIKRPIRVDAPGGQPPIV